MEHSKGSESTGPAVKKLVGIALLWVGLAALVAVPGSADGLRWSLHRTSRWRFERRV